MDSGAYFLSKEMSDGFEQFTATLYTALNTKVCTNYSHIACNFQTRFFVAVFVEVQALQYTKWNCPTNFIPRPDQIDTYPKFLFKPNCLGDPLFYPTVQRKGAGGRKEGRLSSWRWGVHHWKLALLIFSLLEVHQRLANHQVMQAVHWVSAHYSQQDYSMYIPDVSHVACN